MNPDKWPNIKWLPALLLSIACCIPCLTISADSLISKLNTQDTIVFLGDSITELGARPNGYVDLVSKSIQQTHPDKDLNIIGAGVSGNKVPDLLKRLQRDVLSQDPDLVFIYIGINDVWHWTKPHPKTKLKREGTRADDYQAGLQTLVHQIQTANSQVVLCTPTVISEQINPDTPDYQRLEQYAEIVRQVAKDTNSELIDLRKLFIQYLRQNNPNNHAHGILTKDGVHMNDAGNTFIAQAVCRQLGINVSHQPKSPNEMDLYLLIGQSNMAGRAKISKTDQEKLQNCFLFNDQQQWVPASNPLNRYSTVRKQIEMQKLGLGYSFAQHLNQTQPETPIGLVVNALGGSKIQSWQKGERLYQEALKRIKAAQTHGKIQAILWHQGEANCNDTNYLPQLIQMITDFRTDLNRPNLPVIVGQINGNYPVNTQLIDLPNHLPFTACVTSQGLQTHDKWHFNTESQIKLGQRYAEALQSLTQ